MARAGTQFAYQGNMDSGVLFAGGWRTSPPFTPPPSLTTCAAVLHAPSEWPLLRANMPPCWMFVDKAAIEQRVIETVRTGQQLGVRHILNLGHGVVQVSLAAHQALRA